MGINKTIREVIAIFVATLAVSAVFGAIHNYTDLKMLEQREDLHYKECNRYHKEVKADLKEIKGLILRNDRI